MFILGSLFYTNMADTENLLQEDDTTIEFGAENEPSSAAKFKHPVAVTFHLLFKLCAVTAFIVCDILSSNFILNFIVIMLILILDFWTTKNISGRLLVGLRWWNYVDDDGKSHWMYESKQGRQRNSINAAESTLFWSSLFITEIIWLIFCFTLLFRLKWLVLAVIAVILNGANLYGYLKCRIGSGKSMKEYATGVVSKQFFSSAFSMFSKKSTAAPSAGNIV